MLGRHFVTETDQKSLKELMDQMVQTPDQHYYLTKLLGSDYEIKYKRGKENKADDSLSRLHISSKARLLIFSAISFDFLKQVKEEYDNCATIKTLKQEFLANLDTHPDIKYINNFFYHKGCILLSQTTSLKTPLLDEFHTSPTGEHVGIRKNIAD